MFCYLRSPHVKSIFLAVILLSLIYLMYKQSMTLSIASSRSSVLILSVNSSFNSTSNIIDYSPKLNLCNTYNRILESEILINQTLFSMKELERESWATNLTEGTWSPPNCTSKYKVAIIIPYRNRDEHLRIFLNHMHRFLQKQLLSYGIFVIEQAPGTRFNRAALFNIGYKESLINSTIEYDCFIFHDVDLLPSNENNLYICDSSPLHLSVAIDKFNYKLPYQDIFGGAVALSKKNMLQVNGFSNIFFGWGGEDDDMSARLSFQKLNINRYPNSVARYVMVKHSADKGNPVNPLRFQLLKTSKQRYERDGLNDLTYEVVSRNNNKSRLYRNITVQLPEQDILKRWKLS